MIETLDLNDIASYRRFLKIKSLPVYSFSGRQACYPDEYAYAVGSDCYGLQESQHEPSLFLYDYQAGIVRIATRKRKYAVFADCGLGKTLILLDFALAAKRDMATVGRRVLIVSPLMVVDQTMSEADRWYGDAELRLQRVRSSRLQEWLDAPDDGTVGITNYDALHDDITQGNLGGLILDESSMLKSHYGAWGQKCIELGRGLKWKLCCTGTPAPNDRIEYANHAVFLDHYPTVNAFLARFFVNRGQTDNRWELKPHALGPFYRALSHWCLFLTNPATYGWRDNCDTLPPINVHVHDVPMTAQQLDIVRRMTGKLIVTSLGGIATRSKLGQIAKGSHGGEEVETNKFRFIRDLVDGFSGESTIIWCHYNDEQDRVAAEFPDAANIDGSTPHDKRVELIADFKAGRRKVLISKPRILGFGLNLQIATSQVFSGLQDSYEEYYQAVKRSNRIGSTKPLNVHIPVTEIERPMIETVLAKADRVAADTAEQERIFKEAATVAF